MKNTTTHNFDKFSSPYQSQNEEKRIYDKWEKSGYFNPDNLPERHKEPYSVIMPPPNANGRLHAGHGLDMTLKDIAIRFQRMRGKKALFLPGADHAGFETQMVFEKKISKEGRSRFKMSPEELYKEIWDFTMENKTFMEADIRRLGISCDWARKKFTLDKDIVCKVQDTFIKMYADGLVYRGERIVNWNPKFQTSLSDIEVEFVEQKDPFYYLQYGPFVIGTVRPETKFGDKYVVLHPDDKRYKEYEHGQKIELEWINGPITATIIKDKAIDMDFGSGVMTITPWHSSIDFDIAERHDLDKEQIIDWNGKLLPIAGKFAGMKIQDARPKIIEKLKEKGLFVKVDENYTHAVAICERTKASIEPQIKKQWFVKMKPLAEQVIESVEKKSEINILPDNQKKILLHWMHNTIDWNISRQIVWGIPIPAWFKDCEIKVSHTSPGEGWEKDPDTFDTWFSSGQWPLLTLGFPDGKDYREYYPTDLMEAGSDLVFKWIPRMIMFGLYLGHKIPFKNVYFHGMVNDAQNQKMSKSKGNVISPIEVGDKFGTDALRMALIVGNTPGSNIALSENKIKGYKNFANKMWNIVRFVLSNINGLDTYHPPQLLDKDKAYLDELAKVSDEITKELEGLRFDLAADRIYHYIWHTFADIILEDSKPYLNGTLEAEKQSTQWMLYTILCVSLKIAHPFMPFITETIWEHIPNGKNKTSELLMIEQWPVQDCNNITNNNDLVSKTIETYDAFAERYSSNHYNTSEMQDALNVFVQHLKGDYILDVGCGHGRDAKYFTDHKLKVTGIDLSQRFLDIASKKVPGAKFIRMDIRDIDFPDNTFDGLWVSASFLHIPKSDAKSTLIKMVRILKPQGLIYINVEKGTEEKFLGKQEYDYEPRWISFYTEKEFEELIDGSKLSILKKNVDEDRFGWINVLATKRAD